MTSCPGNDSRRLSTTLLLVFFSLLIPIITNAETYVSGIISTDTMWTKADGPYIITGPVQVYGTDGDDGITTLTIEAGTEVRFDVTTYKNNQLIIGYGNNTTNPGALIAQGTESEPILFTSNAPTPAPGDWDGILFYHSCDDATTVLDYCTVEYAGDSQNGNVRVWECSPAITNATIQNSNTNGILISANAFPTITGTTFTGNADYDLNVDSSGAGGDFKENTFNGLTKVGLNHTSQFLSENIFNSEVGIPILEIPGGTISTDTTWPNVVDYRVLGNLTIQGTDGDDGVTTLTIEAGAEIRLYQTTLYVGSGSGDPGALVAQGTELAPIVFTSRQVTQAPGDWYGIDFQNTTDDATSIMEHCIVEYAGYASSNGINIQSSSPIITHTTIRNNSCRGISVASGAPTLSDNTFSDNGDYDVYLTSPTGGILTGNTIANGIYFINGSLSAFTGNTIAWNNTFPVKIDTDWVGRLLNDNTINNIDEQSVLDVDGGTISKDATWTASMPYRINGTLRVQGTDGDDGVTTLTIEAGAEIRLYQTTLYVGSGSGDPGALVAQGTELAPIVFTSRQVTQAPGDWYGIDFQNTTDDATSIMEHCIVEYAGYASGNGINIQSSSPIITHTTIRNNSCRGISVDSGAPTLSDNTFSDNGDYDVYLTSPTGGILTGNTIANGIYFINGSLSAFTGNTIAWNNTFPVKIDTDWVGRLLNDNTINNIDEQSVLDVDGGTISKDATWTASMPYRINGTLRVQGTDGDDGVTTLTIEAGAEIRLYQTTLYVGSGSGDPGALVAQGTELAPIVFTSRQVTQAPGDWYGIDFQNTTDDATSIMEHCIVEYAGYASSNGINIQSSSPIITHTTIRNNSCRGISVASGAPTLSDNTFSDNGDYDVYLTSPTGGILTGNTIANGIYFINGSLSAFTGNTIAWNNTFPVKIDTDWVGRLLNDNTINNIDEQSVLDVDGGTISKDATWTASMPYRINGTLRVQGTDGDDGVTTLTIEAGAEIRLYQTTLYVGSGSGDPGALVAQGTELAPIVFTSRQVTQAPGDWYGIDFQNTTDDATSIMEHCIVEYAGYASGNGINIQSSSPIITHTTIRNNSCRGISVDSGAPTLSDNTFSDNGDYDVYLTSPTGGILTGNTIANGIYFINGSLSAFTGNTIAWNNTFPVKIDTDWVGRLLNDNTINNIDEQSVLDVDGGTISKDATWTASMPYRINGTLRVQGTDGDDGVTTLTIEAGAEIRLYQTTLYVGSGSGDPGALVAQGTELAPIVFTSRQVTQAPGDWYGIDFQNTTDDATSIMEHCIVEYAGYASSNGINIQSSSPIITHTTIRNNSCRGISVDSGAPTLSDNTFSDNGDYDVYLTSPTGGELSNNYFSNGVYFSNGILTNTDGNTFEYNPNFIIRLPADYVGEFVNGSSFSNLTDDSVLEVTGGTLAKDAVWPATLQYYLTSNLRIQGDDGADSVTTLTLEPGAKLRFHRTFLYIGGGSGKPGALIAQGTVAAPIYFTSNQNAPAPGDWYGLQFDTTTADDISILEHCIIEYGGYSSRCNLSLQYASPTIQYNTIRLSSYQGITAIGDGSNSAIIACNNIENNQRGIYLSSATPFISGNNFRNNAEYAVYNNSSSIVVAKDNWWNDENGPGYNGEEIYGNIDFSPWLVVESDCVNDAPTNKPPFAPVSPEPADAAVGISITDGSLSVTWIANDPNTWDTLTYDVYLGTASDSLGLVGEDLTDTQMVFADLLPGATYFWQVVSEDGAGETTAGPVWRFTTEGTPPDLALTAIAWDPETNIDAGQTVVFTATVVNEGTGPSVDSLQVVFRIDGADIATETVFDILYPSDEIQLNAAWTATAGLHTVEVAADTLDVVIESNETNNTLAVAMPEISDPTAPELVSIVPADGTVQQTVSSVVVTLHDEFGQVDDAAVIASFTVQDQSAQAVAGAVTEADDVFTFTPDAAPFASGTYTVTFSAVDMSGNSQGHSISFTVDDAAPAAPGITGGDVFTGTVQVRPALNTAKQTALTLTGTRESDCRVMISGAEAVGFSAGDWSADLTLAEGDNVIELWLEDLAGNRSASQFIDILVDSVAPQVNGITPTDDSHTNIVPETIVIDFLEETTEVVAGASILSVKDAALIEVPGVWIIEEGARLVFTPTESFGEAIYQVEAQLQDALENESTVLRAHFTVDQTPPEAPALDPVTSPSQSVVQVITGSKEPYAAIHLNGEIVVENTPEAEWEAAVTLTGGINTLSFTAMDRAGNESEAVEAEIFFDDTPPLAVETLVLDPEGDGMSVSVSWTAYDESVHGDIAGYRIYAETAEYTSVSDLTFVGEVEAGEFSFTVENLTRGTAYWFAVVAVDVSGNFLRDVAPVSAVPLDVEAPEDATVLNVTCFEDRLILSWQASANTGGDLAGYRIKVGGVAEGGDIPADALTYEKTGLSPASAYEFTLTAFDADGNESTGATYTGITLLGNPTGLSAAPFSGYATLAWNTATPAEYVKHYCIYLSDAEFTDVAGMAPYKTTTKTGMSITGLTNNTGYFVAVTTVNDAGGEQALVSTVAVTPTEDAQGPEITGLTYNDLPLSGGQNLAVSGMVAASASDPAGVSRLEFYFDGDLVRRDYSVPYTCYLDIVNATDGEHVFSITATDTLGNSSTHDYTFTVGLDAPAPPVITAPESGELTNKLAYTVTGTSDKYTDVILIHNGVETAAMQSVGPLGMFSIDFALNEGENRLRAVAENRSGRGQMSSEVVVTVDTSIPDPPRSLTGQSKEAGKIKLLWQRPLDTTLAGYNVYRSSASFTGIAQAQKVNADLVTATGFTDLPDSEGDWYYRVTTEDAAGNESALSDEVSVVSDNTMPRATEISYSPHGNVDLATGRIAPGLVDVSLSVSEPLGSVPFLTITPDGGIPMAVELVKSGDLLYTGSFTVKETTVSGTAWAVFSARDAAGNRGTEIDAGESLRLDTDGPAVTRLSVLPAAPIKNSDTAPVLLSVSFGISDEMASGILPDMSLVVGGEAGRTANMEDLAQVTTVTGDVQSFAGTIELPADAGYAAPETFEIVFEGADDLGNIGTEILVDHTFQVYQGGLPPLAAPTGLKAQPVSGGRIELSWDAVENAAGYIVYRKAPGEGDFAQVGMMEGAVSSTDQTGQDGLHEYTVASIRRENGEESVSGMSAPVQATADAVAPLAPANLALNLVPQGIRCQWEAPPYTETVTYAIYRSSATQITSVAGMTPLATDIPQTMAIDPTPSPTDHCYVITARDAVGNESPPSNSFYLNFDLLPVATMAVTQADYDPPVVSWSHSDTSGKIAGYYAYIGKDTSGFQVNQALMAETSFTDYGFAFDPRSYTIVAVDINGIHSMPRTITLPVVTADLTAESTIDRGIMNRIEYLVENHGSDTLSSVRMKADIGGRTHVSEKFTLAAGETRTVPVIVGGYDTLPDYAPLKTTVAITPNTGEAVNIVRNEEVGVGENMMALQVLNEEFLRGGAGLVQFTFENAGAAEVEIVTAENSSKNPSSEITWYLLDEDENVLYSKAFKQTLGDGIVTLANRKTVARVPAGETFTSQPFELFVPANAPDKVIARVEIKNVYFHLGQTDQVTMKGTATRHPVSLVDTSYYGEITGVSPEVSSGADDIVISGRAIERSSGLPLADASLNLVVTVRGFERKYPVYTDETGAFSHTFVPNSGEAGVYTVRVVHPDLLDKPVHGQFIINRVGISPAMINLSIPKNYEQKIDIKVQTEAGTELTNLRLEQVGDLQSGVHLDLGDPIPAVGSGQRVAKNFTLWADNTAEESGGIELAVKSDESQDTPWGSVVINTHFSEAEPVLYFTPDHIETGVAREGMVTESITFKNSGLADMENISLKLLDANGNPAPNWVQLNAASALGALAVGETRKVNVSFMPDAAVSEGLHTFYLRVTSDNYPETDIGLYASVTQSGIGDVLFKITDIYTGTFNAKNELIRGLSEAKIRLQNEAVLTIDETKTTDAYGEVVFSNLPSGAYKCRITANNHQEYVGRLWIKPGITVNKEVFLEYNLVTVEWEVNEITIQDKYEILLTAVFETDVPAAVVISEPATVELPKMQAGDVYHGEYVLINYGLIRADDLGFDFPESDANYKFELLSGLPDSMEAKERITVPYRITCLKSLDSEEEQGSGGGCGDYLKCVKTEYSYTCANGSESGGTASHCYHYSYGYCGDDGGSWRRRTYRIGGGSGSISYGGGQGGTKSGPGPSPSTFEGTNCPPAPPETKGPCTPANSNQSRCNVPDSSGNQCQTVGSSVGLLSRQYTKIEHELMVKVPGGNISVERFYQSSQWHDRFNCQFTANDHLSLMPTGIYTPPSGLGGGASSSSGGGGAVTVTTYVPGVPLGVNYISHLGDKYYERGIGIMESIFYTPEDLTVPRVFENGSKTITVTYKVEEPQGYSKPWNAAIYLWEDNNGNWMKYEKYLGTPEKPMPGIKLVSFGNRSGELGRCLHDDERLYGTQDRVVGIEDRNGRQVIWYEYDENGLISAIRDAGNRRIEYFYLPEGISWVLEKAINANGDATIYEYDGNKLIKVVDSTGSEISLKWIRDPSVGNRVASVIDNNGQGYYLNFGYDKNKKEYYSRVRSTTGKVKEVWFDKDGNTKRVDINGTTVQKIAIDGRVQIVTDENGLDTVKEYDEWENLIRVEYPDGSVVTREYDLNLNKIIRKADENGNVTEFEYDELGNLTRKAEAVGTTLERISEYTYDADSNLLSVRRVGDDSTQDALTTMTYDENGNMVTLTDPEGNLSTLTYDTMGNMLTREDPRGNIWHYTYDLVGRMLSAEDPLGNITQFVYDGAGKKIKEILPDGKERSFAYDVRGNLSKITDADESETIFEYTFDGKLLKRIDPEGKEIAYRYDAEGRLTETVDGNGNAIDVAYDDPGGGGCDSCSGGKLDQPDMVSFSGFDRHFSYDVRGRNTEVADMVGAGEPLSSRFEYDKIGNVISSTDRENHKTQYAYDSLDRLVLVTDVSGGETRFVYDNRDNLIRLTDADGNITRFEYDRNNRLTKETRPMGEVTTYAYDGAGNLIEKVDPKNQRTVYAYDAAGRLNGLSFFNPADPVNPVKTVSFTYDKVGNLRSYADGTTSGTFTYDDAYRKTAETLNYGAFSLTNTYEYYRNGLKKRYTGPDGVTYIYTYDDNNQLTGVEIPDAGMVSINEYDWMRPARITLPGGGVIAMDYDPLMRLESIDGSDPGGNPVMTYDYDYDKMDNVTSKDTGDGAYAYIYDDLYRLVDVDNPATTDEGFTYDAVGNRLSDENVPGTWSYNANNELTGYDETSFSYDDTGNLIQKTVAGITTNYVYNTEGRLKEVRDGSGSLTASYYYDPFGRRLWKDVGGTRTYFHYSDEGLVGEYNAAGNQLKAYGWKPGSTWGTDPLFMKVGGDYYYYHNDHLGTPQKMVKGNGEVVWSAIYSSFGEAQVLPASVVTNNLRFAGQYYDAETGLHYNWNRYYDPSSGRYLTPDPVGILSDEYSLELNHLYNYVDNDPINYVDPEGFGRIGLGVKIAKKAWNHIAKRHVNRNAFKHKSKFKDPSKIKRDLNKTVRNPDHITQQVERTLYEKDLGREIGTRGEKIQRVVVDKYGNVITSFPSKSFKIPGAALGITLFGDNFFGHAVNFFNPLSDVQDIIDLFQDEGGCY